MIYLDNNATTFLDNDVVICMQQLMQKTLGNPSSIHHFGQEAKNVLYHSMKEVADFFDVSVNELLFTSGATESLNTAILGLEKCPHIITSALEHSAVLLPIEAMKKRGAKVTELVPKKGFGSITLQQVQEAYCTETKLIVLMSANNETGIETEIAKIALFAEEKEVLFLVDGVALLGKERIDIPAGVTAICFSSHKIHGPMGVGLLILRKKHKISPLIYGGPQQNSRRGGTENIIAIAGFARALKCLQKYPQAPDLMRFLRDGFEKKLLELFPEIVVHGLHEKRVCNTSNIYFPDVDGETFLMQLDLAGIAVGLGSACSSGGLMPSKVLVHMGLSEKIARSSLRFSLSRFTTAEEIDQTIEIVARLLKR